MNYSADQLGTIIKMACKKDVIDLGEDSDQDFYIFEWVNMYLQQNAKKIRKTRTSDPLTISSNGYVTFLADSQEITDMYEPYQLLDDGDRAATLRTSFDNNNPGWYREDAYSPIHVRGLNGIYRLKYIKFPDKITLGSQVPECSPASYGELISWVCAKVKLTKNYYQESEALMNDARSVKLAGVKASVSGMGTNAQKPGPDDANFG